MQPVAAAAAVDVAAALDFLAVIDLEEVASAAVAFVAPATV